MECVGRDDGVHEQEPVAGADPLVAHRAELILPGSVENVEQNWLVGFLFEADLLAIAVLDRWVCATVRG